MVSACAISGCGSASGAGLFSVEDAPVGAAGAALSAGGATAASAGAGAQLDSGGTAALAGAGTIPTGGAGTSAGGSAPGGAGAAPSGGASAGTGGSSPVSYGGAGGAPGAAGSIGVAGAGGSAPVLNFDLIDDMEDGDINILNLSGRSGSWYTFSDKTGNQALIVALLNPMRGASTRAMETSGQGFVTWGAGMGFSLNQGGATISPYDASSFQGVRFFGRSSKGAALITIQIPTTQTDPKGGICSGDGCYHNFAVQRMFTGEWTDFVIYFSEFEQDLKVTTTTIDRAHLYAVEFLSQPNAPFDFFIDDVAFIKKD